jgi:hypothetical protein
LTHCSSVGTIGEPSWKRGEKLRGGRAAEDARYDGRHMLKTEHEEIRESVREFVTREVLPIADELDNAEKEIPMPVIG